MSDHVKNQMRPIARNLKAPPTPKFVYQDNTKQNFSAIFKTNVLPFQSVKKIRISHYENGPFLFCAQIESLDKDFQQLVTKLQRTELRHFKSFPTMIGMACLARFEKKVYRGAIAKIPQHQNEDFNVNFVDYGFNRSIKLENLFYIPEEFLTQFTFAMPFSLAGVKAKELKVNEKEIAFYFRLLTENKLLTLKCVPFDGPPIYQYCELQDDDNINILDKLKQWDPYNFKFPSQAPLELKVNHDVKVSYVDSAQEFYIHLQNPEILLDYDVTSDELFKVMSRAPVYRNPKPGSFCAVNLGGEFYRGLVVGAKMNNTVQVKIIDFGIVEEVPEKNVHILTEKFATKAPQAHRACLKGFEALEVSENISTQFDIFCGDGRGERKVFKMVILDTFKDAYLVELEDLSVNPLVNVNKMLLKNSRPLIETIQIENAKKRHKDQRGESFDSPQHSAAKNMERDHNNSQRGRGNYVNKGGQRHQVPAIIEPEPKSPRSHFGKSKKNEEGSGGHGAFFQSQKEASVWGSKESTPSDHNSIKSSDWDQPKNISREQNSNSTWNESNDSQKTQKGKKGSKQKANEPIAKKASSDLKTGWVSTLLSVNRAFVHYDERHGELEKILNEMFAFYENQNSRPMMKELHTGSECAVRSSDGNWYRSKIDSVIGDKVKVIHREYGNSEIVHKSKIRLLDEKFQKVRELGVKTFFPMKVSPEFDEKSLMNEMIKLFENGSKELNFKVLQKLDDGWVLEPINPSTGKNVIDGLVNSRKAQRVDINELQQILSASVIDKPKETAKLEKPKEQIKKERKSPEKSKKIEKVEEKIQEKPQELKDLVKKETVEEKKEERKEKRKEKPSKESNQKVEAKIVEKVQEKPDDGRVAVKMTAVTSPTDFYVSRVDEASTFNKLHSDIQIIASGAAPLTEFEEGTFCLVNSPFDHFWYRAKILDSDETDQNPIISVRCIDDGKTFSVVDKAHLKVMPAAVERKKQFVISCSLPIKSDRKSEADASKIMMNLMEKELRCLFINDIREGCQNFIELFNDNENISDTLVKEKLAVRLEMITPGKGFTSHINSASSFYLQFEMDQLKLELISQYFEEAKGSFEKVDPDVGDIVAALYPEDECWYRSKIEAIEADGFLVSFIDYGNTCIVKCIGKIAEPAIKDLQAMSKHCSLSKPKLVKCFSDQAEKKFVSICANGATILDVKSLPFKAGDAAEVEIFVNGKNIIDQLLPLCQRDNFKLDHTLDSNASDILMSHD